MKLLKSVANLTESLLPDITRILKRINFTSTNEQIVQRQLFFYYRNFAKNKQNSISFKDSGFRVFSQTDEDGLLLFIFSLINFSNKIIVDIAFGSPYGANTTNLICNWGCTGLLFENDPKLVNKTVNFFSSHPDTHILPPVIINKWVTAENINKLIEKQKLKGEIDLLSLDVDGMDYWLWKSLKIISPRVVIIEASTIWGYEKSVSVPYKANFKYSHANPDYCGVSIPALIKLGREKDYRLVACNRFGYNLIFIKKNLAKSVLPTLSAKDCFYFQPLWLKQKRHERLKKIDKYRWLKV